MYSNSVMPYAYYQQPNMLEPSSGNYSNLLPWQQQEQTPLDYLSGIGKSIGAARYNFSPQDLGPMRDIASQIGSLAHGQYDPNDPNYQRIYELERGQGMQDLSAAISEMSRQNRKLSSMGRTPLFSPERGGEMQFRAMAKGYQDTQTQSRNRAREILGVGQNALAGAFGAYGQLGQAQDMNKKKEAFGIGNIADMLPLLGGLFK